MKSRSRTWRFTQFAGGALLVNAALHSAKGLTGQRFPTPFSSPPGVGLSTPGQNMVWGAMNLAISGALLRRLPRTTAEKVTVVTGGVLMGFYLRHYFSGLELDETARA
ncbi:hypothetical protein [Nocardia noduli]|uniref:hypothetical protein n=1 Tax=Nocardia noduli TaxID=2815722 RepID=UPI001C2438B6|nr:hypothetical protein [Nocardia noduli]